MKDNVYNPRGATLPWTLVGKIGCNPHTLCMAKYNPRSMRPFGRMICGLCSMVNSTAESHK